MVEAAVHLSQNQAPGSLCLISLVQSSAASQRLHLLVESLRAFGGRLGQAPLWVFWSSAYRPAQPVNESAGTGNITWIPLAHEDTLPDYPFARKICACAQAEEMAAGAHTLVWLDPNCLVVQPPSLLELASDRAVAFRPVHIRNVGSLAAEPLDDFWAAIYRTVGLKQAPYTIQSFVDSHTLRPYFNTHLFSIDPARGLLRQWLEYFSVLVADQQFQAGACRSELHQIFLHQAVLSALVTKLLPFEQVRILPPEYSYPLHLHARIPGAQRASCLNDLVCPVYEDDLPYPESMPEIEVREPLLSWLLKALPAVD